MNQTTGVSMVRNGQAFQVASFEEADNEALCIYSGNIEDFSKQAPLVRIHSGCITSEVFGMDNCDCKWQLDYSLTLIGKSSCGIVLYLPGQEGKGNGLFNKVRSFQIMNSGLSSGEAYKILNLPQDARSYDFAVRVLKRFKLKKIRLMTNSPDKVIACIDGGLIITERIPVIIDKPNPTVKKLLLEKKYSFKHYIDQ